LQDVRQEVSGVFFGHDLCMNTDLYVEAIGSKIFEYLGKVMLCICLHRAYVSGSAHYENFTLHSVLHYHSIILKSVLFITCTSMGKNLFFSKFSRTLVPEYFHYSVQPLRMTVLLLTLVASSSEVF
jgi:hypothetical protein